MRSRPSAARARTDFSASRDAWNAWDEDLSWVARSRREEVRFSCSRRSVDRASSASVSGGGEVGVGLWRDDPVAVAVVDGVAVSLRCLFRSAASGVVVVVGAELASIVLVGGGMVDDVVVVVVFAVGGPLACACLETSSSGVASSAVLAPSSGVPKRSSEESASFSSSSKSSSLSHPLT